LIHRDIKPDNILIGEDRARVVDFGLAHDRRGGDHGASAGSPSYMAPEVLADEPATEASDQFSFGVTLYEALYGVRPHTGRTRAELRETAKAAASARPGRSSEPIDAAPADDRTQDGPPGDAAVADTAAAGDASIDPVADAAAPSEQPAGPASDGPGALAAAKVVVRSGAGASGRTALSAPSGRAVRSTPPGWLHALVVRALAADPLARFPSMDALAAALGRDRRRRHRVLALVAGGAIVGAALGVVAYRHHAVHDPCEGAAARIDAVWSAATAGRVKAELGPAPWAARTMEGLDATVVQWDHSYRAVCEASRVRGAQSDTLLDLRMRCLDRALARFEALATALATPLDAGTRAEATGAVAELPPPARCETVDDPAELALPADPARRARVTDAERTLDRAWAQYALGRYPGSAKILHELGSVNELGAPALDAAVLLLDASITSRIGQPAAARAQLEAALTAAAAARTPELEAQVWARLLRHELFSGNPARVIEWEPFAHAAAVRAGHEGAEIDGIVGEALRDAGQLEPAREHLKRALASADVLRADQRALLEMNAGSVELAAGSPAPAEAAFARGLALARQALGDGHPTLAIYDDKLAAAARARGRLRDALALHDQSLAARTAAYGETDRSVATSLLGRARTLLEADRPDDATRDATRALEIRTAQVGPASPRLGEIIALQGEIAAATGDRRAALALYDRAGALDPRLDLTARRAAAGADVAYASLPETIDPLTVDRGAALALRLTLMSHDDARPLATALRARLARLPPPVDPALALPIGEAMLLIGDTSSAQAIARAQLAQLADEPSRSRARAQRLVDAALK
jgi:tetratricopeptide (TPR) repeat protein